MFKNSTLTRSVRLALAIGAVSTIGFSAPGVAQEEDKAKEIEKISVTGSRISRADMEGASPLVVISASDIATQGFDSVQDVLDSLSQNSGGSLTQQEVFGFTPAASGVNLRGAGVGRSLILIDGKRLPKYPLASGGTDNFINTSSIPLAAVERIEVLTTGASAIYGSDAMGGVMNFILKEDYEGTNIKVRASGTDEGGRATQTISFATGVSGDDSNITFTAEYDRKNQLAAKQRANFNISNDLAWDHPFSSYSSYGRNLRGPNGSATFKTLDESECKSRGESFVFWGGRCGFDRSSMRDLLPDQDRFSTMLKFNKELTDNTTFYGRVDFTEQNVTTRIESMPIGQGDIDFIVDGGVLTVENPYNPGESKTFTDLSSAFNGDFADAPDGSYWYTHRAVEFGHRKNDTDTRSGSVLFGVEGMLNDDWSYDANWMFAKQKLITWNNGYAAANTFFDVVTRGDGHSLLQEFSDAQVAEMAYQGFTRAESVLTGFQATVSGEYLTLPAGTVGWAFGVETYREWYSTQDDSESQAGRVLTTGGSEGAGKREFDAAYMEAAVPVLEDLTMSLAIRYDDYSDFGDSVAPQIAFEYRPMKELLVRGLWAETFRAPDMQRVYGDPTNAFSQISDPYGCQLQGGTLDPNSPIDACNGELYVDVLIGPNSELDAETGENWNIGAVYSYEGFSASVDYWSVEIEDIVNDLSAQEIATNYEDYEDLITRDPNNGEITDVEATAQNLSFQETAGFDLDISYAWETGFGDFSTGLNATYLTKYESRFDAESDVTDYLTESLVPELRGNVNLNWSMEDMSASLLVKYVGSMPGLNKGYWEDQGAAPGDLGVSTFDVDEYITVNLSGTYHVTDGVSLQAGINNLFDEGPQVDYTDWGWPHYPRSYHTAVGREFYALIELTF